jgi:hypothetical protein
MHPEILRELTAQRSRDLRDRAQRELLARSIRASRHASRRSAQAAPEEFAVPAIPDYVDGSFRVAGDEAAGLAHGQVPAARNAA